MTIIQQTQKQVDKLIADRDAEIATLKDSIEKEAAEINIAEEAMNHASDKGSLQDYQSAKKQLQNAKDAKEMHESRLKKLEAEPLITEQEYKQMISDLAANMDAEVEQAKPDLKKASDQLADIGNKVATDAATTNQLMKQIQGELFRNKDRKKGANTDHFIDTPKQYQKHFDICGWSKSGQTHFMYGQYMKEHPEERK